MSDSPPAWVPAEDALCNRTVSALRGLADAELARKKELSDMLRALLAQRADASDDPIQQAAIDEAIDETERARESHERAARTRDLDPKTPYFGHLVLDEDGRQRELLIAKGSAVDARLPVNIVDWRNAPISSIYYEFEQGEEFWIEVGPREREGIVSARRTLDIRGGVLQTVEDGELVARKRAGNTWQVKRKADEVLERSDQREDPEDHALPDIVALITPDQFGVLTRPDSGVVVLRGQAGSGKTTVALHRIAYLRYHAPERFRLDHILVVMFNKALQTYIHKALADLDIAGVQVSTFHAWASRMLRAAGHDVRFGGPVPPEVVTLKQHPAVEALLVAAVDRLGERLEAWLPVPESLQAAWEATPGTGLARVGRFFEDRPADERSRVAELRGRVWRRLGDHRRDLLTMLDAPDLSAHLPASLAGSLPVAAQHLARQRAEGRLDFADAALLLRLGQLIAARVPGFTVPWYRQLAHIVVDEAQDLSAPAVRVMLDAADEHRSVTLAGDPAQTLYDAGGFGLLSGGGAQLDDALELDTLPVGHRSTRPIMELALKASGHSDPELLARTRPGLPVVWLRDAQASPDAVAEAVRDFRARRPKTLVAVLTRTRADADRWAGWLEGLLADVRRGHRDQFGFAPGVVVSNVHQVKGLEFDGVVLVEPGAYAARERNLLHVAITRAADQLWIVSRGAAGLLEG